MFNRVLKQFLAVTALGSGGVGAEQPSLAADSPPVPLLEGYFPGTCPGPDDTPALDLRTPFRQGKDPRVLAYETERLNMRTQQEQTWNLAGSYFPPGYMGELLSGARFRKLDPATGDVVITYSFKDLAIHSNLGYTSAVPEPISLTAEQESAVRENFAMLERNFRLRFVETDKLPADLNFVAGKSTEIVKESGLPAAGSAGYPAGKPITVFLDKDLTGPVLMQDATHELGHALGLFHPFDSSIFGTSLEGPGVNGLDSKINTVMSYRFEEADAATVLSNNAQVMPMDRVALNTLYGARCTDPMKEQVIAPVGEAIDIVAPGPGRLKVDFSKITNFADFSNFSHLAEHERGLYAPPDKLQGQEVSSMGSFQPGQMVSTVKEKAVFDGVALEAVPERQFIIALPRDKSWGVDFTGGPKTDIITGSPFNDILRGGPGFDSFTGGGGRDTFVLPRGGAMTVTDYKPGYGTLQVDSTGPIAISNKYYHKTDGDVTMVQIRDGKGYVGLLSLDGKFEPSELLFRDASGKRLVPVNEALIKNAVEKSAGPLPPSPASPGAGRGR